MNQLGLIFFSLTIQLCFLANLICISPVPLCFDVLRTTTEQKKIEKRTVKDMEIEKKIVVLDEPGILMFCNR